MLCHFCEDIDLDQAATVEGVAFHASFADICASANDGCQLCMVLRAQVEEVKQKEWQWHSRNDLLLLLDTMMDTRIRCKYDEIGPALIWEQDPEGHNIRIAYLHIHTTGGKFCLEIYAKAYAAR